MSSVTMGLEQQPRKTLLYVFINNQDDTKADKIAHISKTTQPSWKQKHFWKIHTQKEAILLLVMKVEKKKNSIHYIPLLFGHTSLAEAGSQCCPYVHEHNPTGSHEASAEWRAGWLGSSRRPGVSPGVGGPCWPWWELPKTTEVTQLLQYA